jgi:hypothetical protein
VSRAGAGPKRTRHHGIYRPLLTSFRPAPGYQFDQMGGDASDRFSVSLDGGRDYGTGVFGD